MAQFLLSTCNRLDQGDSVTTTSNGHHTLSSSSNEVIENSDTTLLEWSHLEDSLRTIPDNRLGTGNSLRVQGDGFVTNIITTPSGFNAALQGEVFGVAGSIELVSADEVNGQVDLDILCLGLLV